MTACLAHLALVAGLAAPAAAQATAFSPSLVPFGDFRIRQEWDLELAGDRPDRGRQRVRVRAGVHYQPAEQWRASAALRTGNADDPNSPYQTLGDGFDSLDVSFDQAWVRYQPAALPGLAVAAGKFPHPFLVNPIYGELAWDADVRPEGAVASLEHKLGRDWKLAASAGGLVTLERAAGEDGHAWLAQLGVEGKLGEKGRLTLALGHHRYGDLTPGGDLALLADNAGNATVDSDGDGKVDGYASRFRLWHPLVALRLASGPGFTFAAELVHNAGAAGGDGTAWAAGAAIGNARKRGDWQLWYQHQRVEREAVLSAVAQDDLHRSTGYVAHLVGLRWQVADRVGLHAWAIPSRALPDPSDEGWSWRGRIDLSVTP